MVTHEIFVRGVDLSGTEHRAPVIVQMHDDDFPARFLTDLASPRQPQISNSRVINTSLQPLYQPVQRLLNVAMVDLHCNTLVYPRVDPTHILSAGVVIRRVFLRAGVNGGAPYNDFATMSAWMRSPSGQYSWVKLSADQEDCDPDPMKRPQLLSGQLDLDRQLASLFLATASTEGTSAAFAAPPATNAALGRTVVYAVVPTASSEVADTPPRQPVQIDPVGLLNSLPALLRSSQYTSAPQAPAANAAVDFRWMSDDFLNAVYPPGSSGNPATPVPNSNADVFRGFTTALRMLQSVFGAFDGSNAGDAILDVLNQHAVTFADQSTMAMGNFYKAAKATLLDYDPGTSGTATPPVLTMPVAWDSLNDGDQNALITAMSAALGPRSQTLLTPQGRFQDSSRLYRLRMFFRIKGETPSCPPQLVWSHYSEPFRIAAWHETGDRMHPPVPLPDPAAMKNARPNCAFQVPANLMSAMQGSSISGLMSGSGGGPSLKLDWICGFNIPLITICAFFVLNIFLSLLNIVFFWLPFIKICIPFPSVSSASPDEGTP